jgi:hypothetical protein
MTGLTWHTEAPPAGIPCMGDGPGRRGAAPLRECRAPYPHPSSHLIQEEMTPVREKL